VEQLEKLGWHLASIELEEDDTPEFGIQERPEEGWL